MTRPKRKAPTKLEGQALERAADLARSLQGASRDQAGAQVEAPKRISGHFVPPKGWAPATASAITAKARSIRRFSAGELRRRVLELTRPKPVAKEAIRIEDEEEEEEESSEEPPPDPGQAI